MSDPTDVQEYLKRENERRRGDSDDDGDDDSSNSRISGGLYGGGSWDRSDDDRFGGYAFNGV